MIAALKPYPLTKDSGLPWLARMPSHWDLLRGKFLFSCIDIRSSTGEEHLLTVSSKKGVVPRSEASVTMFKAESYVGHKLCWPRDLVINSLWAWAGGLGVSRHHGIVSTAYGVYRLRDRYKSYARYVHHLVRSTPFNFELRVRSKGIWTSRLQLTDDAFLNAPLPIPSLAEQCAIVRFIAHIDEQTQRYIRAKQKLIALLQEQKQTIIQQAVTGQIDVRTGKAYTTYMDSGIEWVGKIPSNWEVRGIGSFSTVGNGSTPSRSNPEYWNNGRHGWVTSSAVNLGTINKVEEFVTDTAVRECHLPPVKAGSVLIGISGQGKTRGMAAMLGIDVTINQHIAYITPNPKLVQAKYLQLFLTCAYAQLRAISSASGSTRPALTCEDIKQFRVAIPSETEQEHLLEVLANVVARIDRCINHVRSQCVLADELRTRLIADVVTGKLDARKASTKPTSSDDDDNERESSVASGCAGTSNLEEPYATVARSEV